MSTWNFELAYSPISLYWWVMSLGSYIFICILFALFGNKKNTLRLKSINLFNKFIFCAFDLVKHKAYSGIGRSSTGLGLDSQFIFTCVTISSWSAAKISLSDIVYQPPDLWTQSLDTDMYKALLFSVATVVLFSWKALFIVSIQRPTVFMRSDVEILQKYWHRSV